MKWRGREQSKNIRDLRKNPSIKSIYDLEGRGEYTGGVIPTTSKDKDVEALPDSPPTPTPRPKKEKKERPKPKKSNMIQVTPGKWTTK